MKMTSKLLVFGAIALVSLGSVLVLQPALASPFQQTTPTVETVSSSLAEVWAQFCAVSQQASYVLLALPENASFEIVGPDGETSAQAQASTPESATPSETTATPGSEGTPTSEATAVPTSEGASSSSRTVTAGDVSCTSLGTVDGKQLVLCNGPALSVFTLNINVDGVTQELPVMPPACAPGSLTEGAIEELLTPTVPALPTDTPILPVPTSTPTTGP